MAFNSISIQPQNDHPTENLTSPTSTHSAAALMAMLVALYTAQKSKKQLRKIKKQLVFTYAKETFRNRVNRFKSLFSRKPAPPTSEKTILYILLGLLVLILIFVDPVVAIAVLLVGILVLLLVYHGELSSKQ